MTLIKFMKEYPVVAQGVRVINAIPPKTEITYLTYRRWTKANKVSPIYRLLLHLKGIKV